MRSTSDCNSVIESSASSSERNVVPGSFAIADSAAKQVAHDRIVVCVDASKDEIMENPIVSSMTPSASYMNWSMSTSASSEEMFLTRVLTSAAVV
uniref:Uncharacterized protein n=1 Tax=Candidatus Methanogaster sp. ANME-2c ERB4 TaxID=2759911 RepID=A0A7G9Y374_9EURY|nr:hypothetical protein LBOOMNCC_00011 [Methanosarcinales archaeon ANME-2c ERB4]